MPIVNSASSLKYEEFRVKSLTSAVPVLEKDTMKVAGSSCREAAKLFGLLLLHCGLLKPLEGTASCVGVKRLSEDENSTGQCFKLWNSKD